MAGSLRAVSGRRASCAGGGGRRPRGGGRAGRRGQGWRQVLAPGAELRPCTPCLPGSGREAGPPGPPKAPFTDGHRGGPPVFVPFPPRRSLASKTRNPKSWESRRPPRGERPEQPPRGRDEAAGRGRPGVRGRRPSGLEGAADVCGEATWPRARTEGGLRPSPRPGKTRRLAESKGQRKRSPSPRMETWRGRESSQGFAWADGDGMGGSGSLRSKGAGRKRGGTLCN